MLSLLKNVIEVILNIPRYILDAVETIINMMLESIHVLFAALVGLIPLPTEPAAPEYVENINWFFPLGTILSIAAPVIAAYITYLAIKWIYKKIGDL